MKKIADNEALMPGAEDSPRAEEKVRRPMGDGDGVVAPTTEGRLLNGIHMQVHAELGRRRVPLADVMKLSPGSVIELEQLIADPIDLFVNDLLVARGEVSVVDGCFCIRICEVLPVAAEVCR